MKKPGLFRSLQKRIHQRDSVPSDVFTHYVALGDSISTDDYPGEGKGAASLFFKNDDRIYPDFENRNLRSMYPGLKFISMAQDGATTSDVLHHQLSELLKIDPARPLLSITAGGNDILSLEADADEIEFRFNTILQKLLQNFPMGKILLGTIYDPTDGIGDLLEPETFLQREMAILHEVNEHIRTMAGHHIEIVDIYYHFLGHGSHCKDPANQHYHVDDPSLWYIHTIEPNVRGGHEIRKLFWNALESSIKKETKL